MSGRWPVQGLAWLCGYSDFFLRVGTLHLFSDVFLVGIIVTDCGTESTVMMGDRHDHDCPLPCRRHR